ncbi:arginase family protein [Cellulosimicrobium sp. Marseille-Q8652]
MERSWRILGAPSSAAAHGPGLEKSPRALRGEGLVGSLRERGLDVVDLGDLDEAVWRSHRAPGGLNDVDRVVDGVRRVLDAVRPELVPGRVPLVLGGECTLTVGVVAAAVEAYGDVGLVYVDGGQDLFTVAGNPEEPIADAMGVAHMLDLPGADAALSGVGSRRPLLDAHRLVFLGFADDDEDERGRVPAARVPAAEVTVDPEAAARRALGVVAGGPFVLHVDVDVLDFFALPAADIPIFGRGLVPDELERILRVVAGHPDLVAMTFVEFNPDHGGARTARALVELLGRALAPA